MLKVYTKENNFPNKKKAYSFHSRPDKTLSLEDFKRSLNEYNSTITPADIEAIMSIIDDKFFELINEGYAIKLPMGTFQAGASGSTDEGSGPFHPQNKYKKNEKFKNHKISLLFKPNHDKEKELCNTVEYTRIPSIDVCITKIISIQNVDKQEVTEIKKGSILKVRGRYLKVNINDENQGVMLRNKNDSKSIYRISRYIMNTKGSLAFQIPSDITVGQYELYVCAMPVKSVVTSSYIDIGIF